MLMSTAISTAINKELWSTKTQLVDTFDGIDPKLYITSHRANMMEMLRIIKDHQ